MAISEKATPAELIRKSWFRFPDKWILIAASFWINFCLLGVHRTTAVIFVALLDQFQIDREEASWPSAVFGAVMCIAGIASGYLSHRFSIRSIMFIAALTSSLSVSLCSLASKLQYITILYGALYGTGIGLIMPLFHTFLNLHFDRYRAVATGIAFAGSSAGSFVFPPVTQLMLEEYGLSGTFLLLGGFMLHSLFGIVLLRTPRMKLSNDNLSCEYENKDQKDTAFIKHQEDTKELSSTSTLDDRYTRSIQNGKNTFGPEDISTCMLTLDILKNSDFLFISAVFSIYFSISSVFLMVIVDFAQEHLVAREFGVYLVSAFSAGDLVGRLSCGYISDRGFLQRRTTVSLSLAAMSILLITFPLCTTYELMLILSIVLGLTNGAVIINFSPLIAEHLGLKRLRIALGFACSFIGLTAFLRPLLIGYFKDELKNYDFLFLSLGVAQLLAVSLWLLKSSIVKIYFYFTSPK